MSDIPHQTHFGKRGARDGGETFLDKFTRPSGRFTTQRGDDPAEVRTALERKSITVGILN